MDLEVKNHIILVTGGSKGLGFACAKALAQEGANILLASRSEAHLTAAADTIEQLGLVRPDTFAIDVSDRAQILNLKKWVEDKYGHLHAMVINAGGPPPGSTLSFSDEEWTCAIHTNLLSVTRLCQAFVPLMVDHKYGRIVAITSVSAKQPIDNLVLSNTTRAAVMGYLKTLSNEVCQHNVLVNVVLPGPTRTERLVDLNRKKAAQLNKPVAEVEAAWITNIPMGRLGEPDELGTFVAFLLSAKNTYTTGQNIAIDGGYVKSTF